MSESTDRPSCPKCGHDRPHSNGTNEAGRQRWRCPKCGKGWTPGGIGHRPRQYPRREGESESAARTRAWEERKRQRAAEELADRLRRYQEGGDP